MVVGKARCGIKDASLGVVKATWWDSMHHVGDVPPIIIRQCMPGFYTSAPGVKIDVYSGCLRYSTVQSHGNV